MKLLHLFVTIVAVHTVVCKGSHSTNYKSTDYIQLEDIYVKETEESDWVMGSNTTYLLENVYDFRYKCRKPLDNKDCQCIDSNYRNCIYALKKIEEYVVSKDFANVGDRLFELPALKTSIECKGSKESWSPIHKNQKCVVHITEENLSDVYIAFVSVICIVCFLNICIVLCYIFFPREDSARKCTCGDAFSFFAALIMCLILTSIIGDIFTCSFYSSGYDNRWCESRFVFIGISLYSLWNLLIFCLLSIIVTAMVSSFLMQRYRTFFKETEKES